MVHTGKSYFLLYVFIRRLRNAEPVAVQVAPSSFLLFTNDGVFRSTASEQWSLWPHEGIWMLSNAEEENWYPIPCFFGHHSGFVVQAAASSKTSWKEWTKEYNGELFVMDLWEDQEFRDLGYKCTLYG